MKGLDLSKFKKHSSDKHTTVLKHKDGHEIHIAHSRLKGDLKKQLDALPSSGKSEETPPAKKAPMQKMASGGLVEDAIRAEDEAAIQQQLDEQLMGGGLQPVTSNEFMPVSRTEVFAPPTVVSEAEQIPKQEESVQNIPITSVAKTNEVPAIASSAASGNAILGAQADQIKGLQMEAATAKQQGQAELQAAQAQEKAAMDLQKSFAESSQRIQSEIQNVVKDYQDGHIDANRMFSNMSGAGKVSTAIGLLLGGIGSALQGGPNVALEFMNKQIDRDIEAQRMEMGKKQNMLSALNMQLGNEKDAAVMAKAIYSDLYASQIAQAAAKSKDPLAQARAMQAIGQIKAANAPAIQEMSMKQAVLQGQKSGSVGAAQAIPILVPKDQQQAAYKQLEEIESRQTAGKEIRELVAEARKLQKIESRVGEPLDSRARIKALNFKIQPTLKKAMGNLSESDNERAEGAFINFLDDDKTIDTKMNVLLDMVNQTVPNGPLEAYGVKRPQAPVNFKPRK